MVVPSGFEALAGANGAPSGAGPARLVFQSHGAAPCDAGPDEAAPGAPPAAAVEPPTRSSSMPLLSHKSEKTTRNTHIFLQRCRKCFRIGQMVPVRRTQKSARVTVGREKPSACGLGARLWSGSRGLDRLDQRWGNHPQRASGVSTGSTSEVGRSAGRVAGSRQARPTVGEPSADSQRGLDELDHRKRGVCTSLPGRGESVVS